MKRLKLNLDELSRELEVLEIDYLKGIKGGYGTPDGGDDDYGTFYGGYGTPDNPIELDPVEIYGGYDDYGSGGGSVFPPGWVPPYDPGDDNYLPGMGGDDGGYGGYNGYDPDFMQDVQDFFNSDPVGQMSDVMNAMGLANGIQELNHSAINALITATGGERITILKDLASKTGLGRICAAGVVFDGLQTIVAFSDGEITGDDWLSLAGTLAGGLAFVPGPWGVVGAGISVGIAIIKAKN